ncbi:MAG: hypothetical protein J4F37_02115 [Acidobacteria bacterium]|nr:hypothetical protein [Acidobacteriota bacterium]
MTPATGAVRQGASVGGWPVRSLAQCAPVFLAGLLPLACAPSPPPVATPTLGVDRSAVPLGGPLEFTIRFDAAPDLAPSTEDVRVLLHFLDPDGALLWADDHELPRPLAEWKPGARIEYTRRAVVPMYPYIGEATVALGLYSAAGGERLPLAGDEIGERTYRVSSLTLEPQPETAFLAYGDGWHQSEFAGDRSWRWTSRSAVVSFRNPRADAALTMELDGRSDVGGERQRVSLAIGARTLQEFELEAGGTTLLRHDLRADDLGSDDVVELTLSVDRPFVPAERNPRSTDNRELGVRVFYLFVEPR